MTIIGVIGKQTEPDLSFISDDLTKEHFLKIQNQFTVHESGLLNARLSHAGDELTHLITNLLKFNPNQRLSAMEALKLPIFDNIRDPVLEQPASSMVQIECDDFDAS
jgi:serine/threonine protein kinase